MPKSRNRKEHKRKTKARADAKKTAIAQHKNKVKRFVEQYQKSHDIMQQQKQIAATNPVRQMFMPQKEG